MINSKFRFFTLLLLLAAAFAAFDLGTRTSWFEKFSEQARQSKTCSYYDKNQGGYAVSAAEWTHAAFH